MPRLSPPTSPSVGRPLTAEVLDPALDRLGRVRLLDVAQRLVQQHIPGGRVVLHQHLPRSHARAESREDRAATRGMLELGVVGLQYIAAATVCPNTAATGV